MQNRKHACRAVRVRVGLGRLDQGVDQTKHRSPIFLVAPLRSACVLLLLCYAMLCYAIALRYSVLLWFALLLLLLLCSSFNPLALICPALLFLLFSSVVVICLAVPRSALLLWSLTGWTDPGRCHHRPPDCHFIVSLDASGPALLVEALLGVYPTRRSGSDSDRSGLDPGVGLLRVRF